MKTLTWVSSWNKPQANECVWVCATKNLWVFVCAVEKTSWRNASTKNVTVRFLRPPVWCLVAVQATYQSTSTGLVKALASTKREAAKPCECLNSNYRQVILQRKILPNGQTGMAVLQCFWLQLKGTKKRQKTANGLPQSSSLKTSTAEHNTSRLLRNRNRNGPLPCTVAKSGQFQMEVQLTHQPSAFWLRLSIWTVPNTGHLTSPEMRCLLWSISQSRCWAL